MKLSTEIWTYLIVTVVAALIWTWAAGETRDRRPINYARVQAVAPPDWLVKPGRQSVALVIEGSRLSLEKAEEILRGPLDLNVPLVEGPHRIDIASELRQHSELRDTGISIVSAEPRYADVELEQLEQVKATVKPVLPGIVAEGEIVVEPAEVTFTMPRRLRSRLPQELTVEAPLPRFELDRLEPGIVHAREVKLRLPEEIGLSADVSISPIKAKVTFAISARTRETKLASVPLQLANALDDPEAYDIEIEPKQLVNVTISADTELIRRIETGEVPVVAMLHLTPREKRMRIESKRVCYFVALVPERGGSTRGTQVSAKVGDAAELPMIQLRISPAAQ